jgi:hypothetical protein
VVRRDGRPVAEFEWDADGLFRTADRDARRHLLGVPSASALTDGEAAAPLRRQLWWALGPDALFVHAAGVGDENGAALLIGPSGAGKSTTSLSCIQAGMGFLGDDYCVVRDDDPPTAHMLHVTARVVPEELAHLGALGRPPPAEVAAPDATKTLLLPVQADPERLLRSAPVRVVLIPTRSSEAAPRVVPVPAAEALRTLAPSALWQMHLEPQRELRGLGRLLSAVPVYRLFLSPRRELNPPVVREAIVRSTA